MKEHEDAFTLSPLPSGISSISAIASAMTSASRANDTLSQTLSHSGGRHGGHSHHQHAGKSDHFRRLEDRIDGLQEQILATQTMIQDLTALINQQQRSSSARQNLRLISAKALKARGPNGSFSTNTRDGPPSSFAIATTFLSSMSPTMTDRPPPLDDTTSNEGAATPPPNDTLEIQTNNSTTEASKPRTVAEQTRKMSASNPIVLTSDKTSPHKASRTLVMDHASMLVAGIKAASLRTLGLPTKTELQPKPEITRRFSISSLDQNDGSKRESHVSRVVKWSRNIFKPRVEPLVSPEDIMNARKPGASSHPLTIRHDSASRLVWDTIVILLIVVDIAISPLAISFRLEGPALPVYNTTANVVFIIDFVVNMLSSYTTKRGDVVSSPRKTIPHYLFSAWSLPDFLSWFPFEWFVVGEQSRFLGVAKVIRLVKISQLARRVHSAKKAGVFRFVQLLGIVFLVSHCLACYWNAVADEWRLQEDGYLTMTLGQQYAHCWSIVIGSLNASPPQMHTTLEEVSVAFFMLIGNVLQATVFGAVAVLISSFDEEEVAYNKKLISTYERCRFLGIPEPLAQRIQGYYENLYRETRSVNTDADSFINELSPALICEVKFQLYRDMIKQIPFLSATNINPVVIEMLILHLRTVIYMQDDVLIRKGEFGDWMGFIGSKGSVGVLDPNSEARKIIRILRKGDYFGEMALLQRAKRSTTAIALAWVQIHVLCRNDLDDVKDQYPEQAQILEDEITKYMKAKVTYK